MGVALNLLTFIPFMAAQGIAIFATAFLASRVLRIRNTVLSRLILMAMSWITWIIFTIGVYAMLGGEGGFMDGFGLVWMLCLMSTIPTTVFATIWALWPATSRNARS
jgi:hypothetical protein